METIRQSHSRYEIGLPRICATKHFINLTKNHEATLNFLKDLKFNSSFPEYQAILGPELLERRLLRKGTLQST